LADLEVMQAAIASTKAMVVKVEEQRADEMVVKHPQVVIDDVYHPLQQFPLAQLDYLQMENIYDLNFETI
jgi:uncharacterized protein YqfA (UPF0365 family)